MIEKAKAWKGRAIKASDIKDQAILTPRLTRHGIEKRGEFKNRKTVVDLDFQPTKEVRAKKKAEKKRKKSQK